MDHLTKTIAAAIRECARGEPTADGGLAIYAIIYPDAWAQVAAAAIRADRTITSVLYRPDEDGAQ